MPAQASHRLAAPNVIPAPFQYASFLCLTRSLFRGSRQQKLGPAQPGRPARRACRDMRVIAVRRRHLDQQTEQDNAPVCLCIGEHWFWFMLGGEAVLEARVTELVGRAGLA